MKKVILILVCILSFGNLKSQVKGIPVEGKCFEVIQALRDSFKNDTLAINFLKDNYTISNITLPSDFYKKEISEIIRFFNDPIRKESCECYIRNWRERNALLIE